MLQRSIQFGRGVLLFSILYSLTGASTSNSFLLSARYLVTLRSSVVDPHAAAQLLASRYQLKLRHTYAHALKGFSATGYASSIAQLRGDPLVTAVELSRSGELMGLDVARKGSTPLQSGQVIPFGVQRIGADRSQIAQIDGVDTALDVDIAVIDSGIQPNHPDLNLAGSVVCNGGQLFEQQPAVDLTGHGTAVAGVIAARDNQIGVVGVVPGARLWSIRVAQRTPDNRVRYDTDDLICAVDWVAAHADVIEVVNISLGAYAPLGFDHGPCGQAVTTAEAALHHAICHAVAAGVTFVVAAGEPRPSMPRTDSAAVSPAAFAEVITVSGMADFDGRSGGRSREPICQSADRDDTFWNESNYGLAVDLVAPALCISTTSDSLWSGTSFAAPYVAGAAALYKIARPAASPAEVKRALVASAQPGWNVSRSAGRPYGDDPDNSPEPLINVQALTSAAIALRSAQRSPATTTTATSSQVRPVHQQLANRLWE